MRTLLVAVVLLVCACFRPVVDEQEGSLDASVSEPRDGGESQPDPGRSMYGVTRADCAPNDGPAWFMVLSETPVGCEVLNQSEGYFIDLWVGSLVPGTTYELTPGGNRQGSACQCGAGADNSIAGTVRIDAVSPQEVSGHIDATFRSGAQRQDTFKLTVCPSARLCG